MKKTFTNSYCFILLPIFMFMDMGSMQFKDAHRKENKVELVFEMNGKQFLFDAAKSNLAPYILFNTGNDGTIKVNEKLRNHHFKLSYGYWPTDRTVLYIINLQELGGLALHLNGFATLVQ